MALLHLSSRDFFVDPKNRETTPFWIDEKETLFFIASRCPRLLYTDNNLRRDICDMKLPGNSRTQLNPEDIAEKLPPKVQYACLHWVRHCLAVPEFRRLRRDIDDVLKVSFSCGLRRSP